MKLFTSTDLNVLKLLLIIFSGMPHLEINLQKPIKNHFVEKSGVNELHVHNNM